MQLIQVDTNFYVASAITSVHAVTVNNKDKFHPAIIISFNDGDHSSPIILDEFEYEKRADATQEAKRMITALFSNNHHKSIISIPCFSPSALSVSL